MASQLGIDSRGSSGSPWANWPSLPVCATVTSVRCWLLLLLLATGCDPAEFRPAKGAREQSSVKEAFRVKDEPGCPSLGFVREAASIEDVASTAARHGGDTYRVIEDFGHTSVETDTVGRYGAGAFVAQSSSETVSHHRYVAEVYRCHAEGGRQ